MDEEEITNPENQIELSGFITFYKFENEANSYRIASFKIDDNKLERNIIIVGYFPHYERNENLTVKGTLIRHKKYGLQVEVSEIYVKLPSSKENIIRFFSSSQFKGIGKSTAEKIYDYLKDEAITTLINHPDVYDDMVSNRIITNKQQEALKEGLRDFDYTSNAFQVMLKYGFSLKNIMKAEATYGESLSNIIENNPYQMAIDIDGIGFKTIDKIALNNGIKEDDPRRVKAAIIYSLLNLCYQNGNTYNDLRSVYFSLCKLIKIEPLVFKDYVDQLVKEKLIYNIEDKYFHYSFYNAERTISEKLKPFILRNINTDVLNMHFQEMIERIEEDEGISYSKEQIEAIYNACGNGIHIITGGPGTGKTTILKAILKMLSMLYDEEAHIALCAPTGRASKRMSYLSNHHATTIHSLLKWDLHSNTFSYNANNQLKIDVIIIDEFSMVDTLLFEALLNGTKEVSQIILIGDDGQIPSVGAGNLLYDMLQVKEISHTSLSHIYRQSEKSNIVELAYKIRFNELDESFEYDGDTSFIRIRNYNAPQAIVDILKRLFDAGYDFDDIQVIAPMYANVAGIDNINSAIQAWYNPSDGRSPEIRMNQQIFRIGDRVLQLKNQPEDDIFNGDIGTIVDIDLKNDEIMVNFDVGDVIYTKATVSNLTLAYAISIHKSQGSEFNFVIMCVFPEYGALLNKKLLYTGITRAKKSLMILGDYYTFIKKVQLEDKNTRKTYLKERILQSLE